MWGVSQPAISKRIKNGTLQTNADGTIPRDVAEREARARGVDIGGVAPADTPATEPAPEDGEDLLYWRTRNERAKALTAELERDELEGLLIRRDAVAREAAEFSVLVRDRLRNIPMRLRDRLAAETSPRVCGDLVAAEIDKALNVLAGGE